MKCYTIPYEGDQDYLFFSYCHDDVERVYPIIERLAIEGFRVWFDDGIHPGEDWPDVIAAHLSNAKACVAAISKNSSESHNCRNEVSFAIGHNKPFLSIILENFKMPLGMQLQLSSTRFLKNYEQSIPKFYESLLSAPLLIACKEPGSKADGAELRAWQKRWYSVSPTPVPPPTPNKAETEVLAATDEAKRRYDATQQAAEKALSIAEAIAKLKVSESTLIEEAKETLSLAIQYKNKVLEIDNSASFAARAAQNFALVAEKAAAAASSDVASDAAKTAKEFATRAQKASEEASAATKVIVGVVEEIQKAVNSLEDDLEDDKNEIAVLDAAEKAKKATAAALAALEEVKSASEAALESLSKDSERTIYPGNGERNREAALQVASGYINRASSALLSLKDAASRSAKFAAKAIKAGEKSASKKVQTAVNNAKSAEATAKNAAEEAEKAFQKADDKYAEVAGRTIPRTYNPALFLRVRTREIFSIKDQKTIVGKLPGQGGIVISNNNEISRKHIEIIRGKKDYRLHNLKPTNETIVDGRELVHDEYVSLTPWTELYLSDEQFFLLYGEAYDYAFDSQRVSLLYSKKTGEAKIIDKTGLFLDRNHKTDWRDGILDDKRISRASHAEIIVESDRIYIRQTKAAEGKPEHNPTYLNGEELSPIVKVELHDGDLISVVETEFEYHEIRIGA